MSATQRASRRDPLASAANNTEAGAAGKSKIASNPFMQQEQLRKSAGTAAARPRRPSGAEERENRLTPAPTTSSFAAARRRFASPASQESLVVRSQGLRKKSDAAPALAAPSRVRLSRQSLATLSSAASGLAPAPTLARLNAPASRAPAPTRWMDDGRTNVQAYEYLCHCGEAQQWIERCIGEPLGGDIAQMGEDMRNGIALAKLAKSFEPACVPRIFVHPKLQFRHTDNINYFFQFLDKIRLPNCFRFELTDLYEKKNFPKVVYCLHALSHYMAHQGRSDKVDDLLGQLEFDDAQLTSAQKSIDAAGVAMPSFGGVGQALAQEMGTSHASKRAAPAPKAPAPPTPKAPAAPELQTPQASEPKTRLSVPAAATLAQQRAHLKPVPRASDKAPLQRSSSRSLTPLRPDTGTPASARARLKPVPSEPVLRDATDRRAQDALARERARAERDQAADSEHERIARLGRERLARMEEREAARRAREEQRARELKAQQQARQRQREERERRLQERERERERMRAAPPASSSSLLSRSTTLLDERERRDQLYTNVRSVTQRELARERERLAEERERERQQLRDERERERRAAEARLQAAEARAARAAREHEDEERARFQRELEYEWERERQRDAYAAELAAAHAETAAAEARLQALTDAAARRDAAEARERAIERWAPLLQAHARGVLVRRVVASRRERLALAVPLQAHARGVLVRRALYATLQRLDDDTWIVGTQACVRGRLVRTRLYERVLAVEDEWASVVQLQAAARGLLTRRALLHEVEALVDGDDLWAGLQAAARGALARRAMTRLRAAFHRVEVVQAVHGMQTSLRAALQRRQHDEKRKQLAYVTPDVTGIQAHIRGALVRQEHGWWRAHLHASQDVVVYLQAMLRGVLARRVFDRGLGRYVAYREDVILVQSLVRARQQGRHYQALLRGTNVPLATVRRWADLLDDRGVDYEEEAEVESWRAAIVQKLRENEAVEAHVQELDRQIALLVKNRQGLEARQHRLPPHPSARAVPSADERRRVLAHADDPFGEHALSPAAFRRLELYQSLFYLVQTRPVYLARLLLLTQDADVADEERRQLEQTVLAIFAYAQQPREARLLLKLVDALLHEHLTRHGTTLDAYTSGAHAPFLRLLTRFSCGVQERAFLAERLTPPVQHLAHHPLPDVDLDPVAIQRALAPGAAASDDPWAALEDPAVHAELVQRLQHLRSTTERFVHALCGTAAPALPYTLAHVAHAHYVALTARFPHSAPHDVLRAVSYTMYRNYVHPAIVAPESFGMPALPEHARRHLVQVSQVLAHIAHGTTWGDEDVFWQPLQAYVADASARWLQWMQALLDSVETPERHFGINEYTDASSPRRPVIYIAPNEIYAVHQLLATNERELCAPDDPLAVLLLQLGAPPSHASSELHSARESEITLTLSHRFADIHDDDAEAKQLFAETKRLIVTLLRAQDAPDLWTLLVQPITEADDAAWALAHPGTEPLTDLKSRALENVLRLEQLGRLTRADAYQGLLDAIAADIRGQHKRRLERRTQIDDARATLQKLDEQRAYMEAQIQSYHQCMDRGLQTLQRRKKSKRRSMVMPFSPQFFHQRSLKAAGVMPKYGSYRYSASRLRAKGVLAHIDRPENLAIDQLSFTIASDELGVFTLEATVSGVVAGTTVLRMERMLQAQDQAQRYVAVLDNSVHFHLDALIQLINKSTYRH